MNLGAEVTDDLINNAIGLNEHHIVQLLRFAEARSNVGTRVKNMSHSILKQNIFDRL